MDVSVLLSSPVTWIVTILSLLYLLYRRATAKWAYFSDQGIPGPKPSLIVGNAWGIWNRNLPAYDIGLMKKYGKIVGIFDCDVPDLFITDIDMIKSIYVKNFDHFIDRRVVDLRVKVARKFLTTLRGQEWKDVRTSITPALTTGKIKNMSKMILECVDGLLAKLKTTAEEEGKFDAKEAFGAFSMDVIARCAFGMKIDSLGNKDDPFVKNAKVVFNPPMSKSPLFLLPFIFPFIVPIFGKMFFVRKEFQFFFNNLDSLIKERRQSKDKYYDFVETATEAISEYTKETTDGSKVPMWETEEVDEIVIAQSTLFMLGGYDTTANTLSNTIFMLTIHPEIQEKLYDAVVEKLEKYEDVCHEMVLDFPYLDNILHETLRMLTPVARIERQCVKDFSYENIHIKKGTIVTVPIFALHNDEDYYTDPSTFNPDRWSTDKISPYVWMPFGMGPRNCVGMRFAMEEIKLALCTLVKHLRFVPVAETPEKMDFEDGFLVNTQARHPIVVGIELRE